MNVDIVPINFNDLRDEIKKAIDKVISNKPNFWSVCLGEKGWALREGFITRQDYLEKFQIYFDPLIKTNVEIISNETGQVFSFNLVKLLGDLS